MRRMHLRAWRYVAGMGLGLPPGFDAVVFMIVLARSSAVTEDLGVCFVTHLLFIRGNEALGGLEG